MTRIVIVLAFLLVGISAAQAAAPIKAKCGAAVSMTSHPAQDKQLTQMMREFAATHALKPLSHQGANALAYRSTDDAVELAVTSGVGDLGSIVTLFDVNQSGGLIRGTVCFLLYEAEG
jgi:hypothetical protein